VRGLLDSPDGKRVAGRTALATAVTILGIVCTGFVGYLILWGAGRLALFFAFDGTVPDKRGLVERILRSLVYLLEWGPRACAVSVGVILSEHRLIGREIVRLEDSSDLPETVDRELVRFAAEELDRTNGMLDPLPEQDVAGEVLLDRGEPAVVVRKVQRGNDILIVMAVGGGVWPLELDGDVPDYYSRAIELAGRLIPGGDGNGSTIFVGSGRAGQPAQALAELRGGRSITFNPDGPTVEMEKTLPDSRKGTHWAFASGAPTVLDGPLLPLGTTYLLPTGLLERARGIVSGFSWQKIWENFIGQ
jgi:hypothetical protein